MSLPPTTPVTPSHPALLFQGYTWLGQPPAKQPVHHKATASSEPQSDEHWVDIWRPRNATQAKTTPSPQVIATPDLEAPPTTVAMQPDTTGRYWVARVPVQSGEDEFYYRFSDNMLDATETRVDDEREHGLKTAAITWNVARKPQGPQTTASMAYVYPDSHLPAKAIAEQPWLKTGDPIASNPAPDPARQWGGNVDGLNEAIGELQHHRGKAQNTIGAMMMTPMTDDANVTGHHYWTTNPLRLNSIFKGDLETYRQFFFRQSRQGIKPYADGAFVNLGMMSPQYQSILIHGLRSPYWNWFIFDSTPGKPLSFSPKMPEFAKDQRPVLGVLPAMIDKHGTPRVDWDNVRIKIVNNPKPNGQEPRYNPKLPTYIELSGAAYPYRFPVSPKEAIRKLETIRKASDPSRPDAYEELKAQVLSEWSNFRLGRPDEDNSGQKWDGKIHAVRLNLHNPDVQQFAQQAITYWTERSHLAILSNLTNNLCKAFVKTTDPKAAVRALEHKVDPAIIQKTLQTWPDQFPETEPAPLDGPSLWQDVQRIAPFASLPIPNPHYQPLLSTFVWPEFNKVVFETGQSVTTHVLNAVTWPVRMVLSWFSPKLADKLLLSSQTNTTKALLQNKLEQAIQELTTIDPESGKKLNNKQLHAIAMEAIAQPIMLFLLSGEWKPSPEHLSAILQEGLSAHVFQADPSIASRALNRWIRLHAEQLPTDEIVQRLQNTLKPLREDAAQIAQHMIDTNEMGLNWRIDAVKDIGDIDRIRNLPDDNAKPDAFYKEMLWVRDVWSELFAPARQIFPKMAIIGELTDFGKIGGSARMKSYNAFFEPHPKTGMPTLTSMPNMDNLFSGVFELIHFAPKNFEYGDSSLKPSTFMDQKILNTLHEFPRQTVSFFQNINSSHDYATMHYNLLRNPMINTMHYNAYRGLQQDAVEAIEMLATSPDCVIARETLERRGVKDPVKAFHDLAGFVAELDPQYLDVTVQDYFTKPQKEAVAKLMDWAKPMQNPMQLRAMLAHDIMTTIQNTPHNPKVSIFLENPSAFKALKTILQMSLTYPGEVWATRAALTNALEQLPQSIPKKVLYMNLDKAFGAFTAPDERQAGYLSIATLIDEWVGQTKDISDADKPAIKKAIFQAVMAPAMEKAARMVATQMAVPGQPTVYFPDFLAQSGGEWTNNRFQQNRDVARLDWLKTMPAIQQHFQRMKQIMAIAQQFPVRNHGFFVPLEQDDDRGVMLTAWDGGPSGELANQQLLCLVNVPKESQPLDWDHLLTANQRQPKQALTTHATQANPKKQPVAEKPHRGGVRVTLPGKGKAPVMPTVNTTVKPGAKDTTKLPPYPTIKDDLSPVMDYKPTLKGLNVSEGARFEDVLTHERFVYKNGHLVTEKEGKGFVLNDYRFLKRL